VIVQLEAIDETTADAVEARRGVRAQALVREVNEQIHRVSPPSLLEKGLCEILCECVNPDCLSPLEIPTGAYEDVRRFPTRFVVAPTHVAAAFERVVDEGTDYLVVEKIGPAAAIAVRLDPRRNGHDRLGTATP
jgi:hypothetical protein